MREVIKSFINKINLAVILIILIPFLLNIIWFREGNIFGYAESGLPFYNFQNAYDSNKTAWNHYALGFPTNINIAGKPTYWFMAQLQSIGIPGFILQASFFWIILVISGFSIYYISKNLFPILNQKFLILSTLFYWFNPFSMVNVWNRFLNSSFVFYMLLPLSLLIFLKGVQSKKYIYAFLIGLASTIFSYALSSIVFNILLWLVLFYTSVFYVLINRDNKYRFFVIKFFLLTLFFLSLTNLWWISQTLSYVYSGSFSTVSKTSFSLDNNQQILTNLSQKLGNLIYILRFEHGDFFSGTYNLEWVKLYTFPLIVIISFLPSLVIFLPLFFGEKKGSVLLLKSTLFLSGLIIVGIFLSKGNNPPFGELFNFVFVKIGFLQSFRNAFEKFGFLLPLSGASLFAYGIYILTQKIPERLGRYIYLLSVLWLIGIYGLPYWTGLVFTSQEFPVNLFSEGYKVKVPDYYKKAADWLKLQKKDFRLLVFPLGGEGITYNWEKGYSGVELSNQLLPVTAVSFQTNIPFYEDLSGDLEKAFLSKGDFTKTANILNAKYVMFRNDIDWRTRGMRNPQIIFQKLKADEKKGLFKLVNSFEGLTFWESLDWVDRKVYLSDDVISVSSQPKISDSQFISGSSDVLVGDNANLSKVKVKQEVIHPFARLSLDNNLNQSFLAEQDLFPHIRFSPESKFYQSILLKEDLDFNSITDVTQKLNFIIKMLGKRLVEAKSESELDNPSGVLIAIYQYNNLLEKVSIIFPEYKKLKADNDMKVKNQEELYNIFSKHKILLGELINRFSTNQKIIDKLQSTQKLIDSKLIDENIKPLFGFKEGINFPIRKRIDYKFNIITSGEYELLWGDPDIYKYYKGIDSQIILQIDNQLIERKVIPSSLGLISYGKLFFDSGIHEMAINTPEEINLIDHPRTINLEVQHGEKRQSFPIKDYDPYSSYVISFDYWIKKGSGINVLVESNNARIILGEIQPDFIRGIGPDNYNYEEKHFSTTFKLNNTSDAANLILIAKPWNDCESIFYTRDKERCKEESFRRPYDRTTEVVINNISVTRNFVDEPVLIKSNSEISNSLPRMNFKKIDNTKYILNLVNVTKPYVLVLSELFDPNWKIFIPNGQEVKTTHFVANAYANGWEIEKSGTYQLVLKFVPQDLLNPTEKISQVIFLIGIVLVIWNLRRNYVMEK